MATKRISDLTAVNLVSSSALFPIVQDGATVTVTFGDLTGSIGGTATASYALTAETASYAISASYEISYETSSSYAETATTASYAVQAGSALTTSYALVAEAATSASYALTASYAETATPDFGGTGVVSGSSQIDGTAIANNVINLGNTAVTLGAVSAVPKWLNAVNISDTVLENAVASGSFSGSFEGDGSGLTGISAETATTASYALSAEGSLEGAGFVGTPYIDFWAHPEVLKRDNLIIHNNNVQIGVPAASNFEVGTVLEFDIYIPTGSTWVLGTFSPLNQPAPSGWNTGSVGSGFPSSTYGFLHHGSKGFNSLDFNPYFADNYPYYVFGQPGYTNGKSVSFGSTDGDNYHEGPALVRLVAVKDYFEDGLPFHPFGSSNPASFWAGRIISRSPMSNSVGTGLAIETVSTLPATGNSAGDLVMFNDGVNGLKLHVYNGTSWDQLGV